MGEALSAYGQAENENTAPIQVSEKLLEHAAVYALTHRDPERIRLALYHVKAWILLWPSGPGRDAALERADTAVRAAEHLCLFPPGAGTRWSALAEQCRALADFLREALQTAGGS